MRRVQLVVIAIAMGAACGGGSSSEPAGGSTNGEATSENGSGGEEAAGGGGDGGSHEFRLNESTTAGEAHGDHPSQITSTETHAAMRLFVVDPETGPIQGIVIKMTGPDGTAYFTGETDTQGYAEVLVPMGQRYGMEYLSLGRRNSTANVDVPAGPRQDIRLTLRYRRQRAAPRTEPGMGRFVLDGVVFDTNSATIKFESYPRLDRIVEYMRHKETARIRIAGYTDNVGNARANQRLSEQRAESVRTYLVNQGIDAGRIEAVGYGDQNPLTTNDTEAGREQNRRIEAVEL